MTNAIAVGNNPKYIKEIIDCLNNRELIIIGEKEKIENKVSVRKRFKGDMGMVELDTFIDDVCNEIKNKGV